MTLALVHIPAHLGYLFLFVLVAAETSGIPLPGETAMITAGVLAQRGTFSIEFVIVVAATAAIVGDNIGYLIGRTGGRRLLTADGPFERHRLEVLRRGEPFFAKHGPKAVFFGRWITGLRIAASWLAGMNRMEWKTFFFWNALGGICWAISIGLLGYFAGPAVEHLLKYAGFAGGAAVVAVLVAVLVWRRRSSA